MRVSSIRPSGDFHSAQLFSPQHNVAPFRLWHTGWPELGAGQIGRVGPGQDTAPDRRSREEGHGGHVPAVRRRAEGLVGRGQAASHQGEESVREALPLCTHWRDLQTSHEISSRYHTKSLPA